MLTDMYSPGDTVIHTTKPSLKLACLFVVCTTLFVFESWPLLIGTCCAVAWLYYCSQIFMKNIVASICPAFSILALIFFVQLYLSGFEMAAFVVIRFIAMILAASLLTLTTPSSDLMSAIEKGVQTFASERFSEAVGLAFSLSFRCIPRVRQAFNDVREAQKARGLQGSWKALTTPTIIRILRSADEIAQAINSRNIDTSHLREQ